MNINYDEYEKRYVRVITVFINNDYSNKETFYGYMIDHDEHTIKLSMLKGIKVIKKSKIKNIIIVDKIK